MAKLLGIYSADGDGEAEGFLVRELAVISRTRWWKKNMVAIKERNFIAVLISTVFSAVRDSARCNVKRFNRFYQLENE